MKDTDVKIPIETWMQSQDASGFQKIIGEILDDLDLDSLSNCRQVSKTFKKFLDKKYTKDFWLESLSHVIALRSTVWPCLTKRSGVLHGPCFLTWSEKEGPSTTS